MKTRIVAAAAVAALTAALAAPVEAGGHVARKECRIISNAQSASWHGSYYHVAWGSPVALVVPPTAERQTHYGWGVGATYTTPIWHQFSRNYPGPGAYGPHAFLPTPPWPSSTDQFGVYYVRGPW
jgi:hypothetical protein